MVLSRGKGQSVPAYANGIHQDFGLNPDEYQQNLRAHVNDDVSTTWKE